MRISDWSSDVCSSDLKKTRRLSRQELRDLVKALRDAGDFEHPVGLAIIRLLVLSGLRLNEGQGLERAWVAADGYIVFSDTKTGEQIHVIGAPALRVQIGRAASR